MVADKHNLLKIRCKIKPITKNNGFFVKNNFKHRFLKILLFPQKVGLKLKREYERS